MSGAIVHSVNNLWSTASQANVSPAVFFHMWLEYLDSHTGLDVVDAGVGASSLGPGIPAGWLSWTRLVAVPWADNAWVVVRATNADALLNGGGSNPWHVKIQYTSATAYADPSGTNYGKNGATQSVVMRANAKGTWVSSPTFDFSTGGAPTGQDMAIYFGQNECIRLDIYGDDDTIIWRDTAFDLADGIDVQYDQLKSGYLGMFVRRSTDVVEPFFAWMGRCYDGTGAGEDAKGSRSAAWLSDTVLYWPSYSISRDGTTRVTAHSLLVWDNSYMSQIWQYAWDSDILMPALVLTQYQSPDNYANLGELRWLFPTSNLIGRGVVFGTLSDYLNMEDESATRGGFAMAWPAGVTPDW